MPLTKVQSRGTENVGQGSSNLIINGAMAVDQRNSGSSFSQTNGAYNLDRFRGNSYDGGATTGKFTVQQSSTAPDDFDHSLLVTSSATTADASNNIFNIEQLIEGFNSANLNYGSSSAKTITLSFHVRSSLTGTFGGALKNNARNRNYPFTYTISSANTFEKKVITISGDTTGTWVGSTNGIGLWLSFGLGVGSNYSGSAGAWGAGDYFSATGATSVVGTNGATWYITGIQLEVGSQASDFQHEDIGITLQRCQRYYHLVASGSTKMMGMGDMYTTSQLNCIMHFPVQMRAVPSLDATSGTNYYRYYRNSGYVDINAMNAINGMGRKGGAFNNSDSGNGTAGQAGGFVMNNSSAKIAFDAEL